MQVRELVQAAKPAQQEELYRSARLLLGGSPETNLQRTLPVLEVISQTLQAGIARTYGRYCHILFRVPKGMLRLDCGNWLLMG